MFTAVRKSVGSSTVSKPVRTSDEELVLAGVGQPVRRARRSRPVGHHPDLLEETRPGQRLEGVVDRPRVHVRPLVDLPADQLTAQEVAVHGLEDPHAAEHEQARRGPLGRRRSGHAAILPRAMHEDGQRDTAQRRPPRVHRVHRHPGRRRHHPQPRPVHRDGSVRGRPGRRPAGPAGPRARRVDGGGRRPARGDAAARRPARGRGAGRPAGVDRAGRARRRRRAQRRHGLGRAGADARRAAGGQHARAGQQGVARRRRSAGARRAAAPGPDRAGRLRALGHRAGAARRHPPRGPTADPHGLRGAVPRLVATTTSRRSRRSRRSRTRRGRWGRW